MKAKQIVTETNQMYINLDFGIDFEGFLKYLKPKVEQALDSDIFKRPWGCKKNLDFED